MDMKFSDIVMVCAVLVAPVLAVQVQKWLEVFREKRGRKLRIFKTLMATRAATISADHVQALNMIDLEFSEDAYKNVTGAWKIYLDCLGDFPKNNEALEPVWAERRVTLLTKLLLEMGRSLGFEFDEVHIKKGIYSPEGHERNESENLLIRQGLVRLLYGDSSLKMDILSLHGSDEVIAEQKAIRDSLQKILDGDRPLPVRVARSIGENENA
jgi:hypothetical protein